MNLKIDVFPHVYLPQTDTFFLIEYARTNAHDEVLELCTGCGIIALHLAPTAACVYATDSNPHAVKNATHNAHVNGINNIIIRQGDLYQPIEGQRFDLICANPPYVPTPPDWQEEDILEKSWNAGPDGRQLLDRIITDATAHLKPSGRLLLVQSSLADIHQTLTQLQAKGFSTRILAQRWLELGPISRSRYQWLKSQGRLINTHKELLAVIEARAR